MDGLLSVFDGMTDEELRALFEPYQNQQDVISQEMGLAQQLRQPRGGQHSSPLGAALGGLGDAIGNTMGAYKQSQALEKQRALGKTQQEDALSRLKAAIGQDRQSDEMDRQRALEEFLRNRDNDLGFNTGITNWGG